MSKVIDAEYEYVAGPHRVGDEHPERRGWFYTGQFDRRGVALWYKPPSALNLWTHRIAKVVLAAWFLLAFAAIAIYGA